MNKDTKIEFEDKILIFMNDELKLVEDKDKMKIISFIYTGLRNKIYKK